MALPKVSIIIPVYNGADYLSEAIESALAQTWKNTEVIVINDGSNDQGATERIALSYGNRIRYIRKDNGGVASALNRGIQEMTGDYFSWLSHDDLYLPRKIEHQMKLLRRCGNPTQIVAGGYYIVDGNKQPLGVMDFYQLYPKKKLEIPLFPVFHCAVNGCTMLIHKSHFERVGVFDEGLPTTQDYDLWFRMLRGQRLVYTRWLDVVSRAHEGQTSQQFHSEHNIECTNLWIDLLKKVSLEEKRQIGGNESAFYSDLFSHFFYYTNYSSVVDYLKTKTNHATPTCYRRRISTVRHKIDLYIAKFRFFFK